MPLYEFRVKLKDRSMHKGVRQLESHDIDFVYRTYLKKAEQHYRNDLQSFDVAMISKLSAAGRAFIEGQRRRTAEYLDSWQVPQLDQILAHPKSHKKGTERGKML